jgi:hypothetical protein
VVDKGIRPDTMFSAPILPINVELSMKALVSIVNRRKIGTIIIQLTSLYLDH